MDFCMKLYYLFAERVFYYYIKHKKAFLRLTVNFCAIHSLPSSYYMEDE